MKNPGQHETPLAEASAVRKAALAIGFGLSFGFLLQKGGVAKFHLLIGALLLQDWTVMKMMLSAVVVGMAGFFLLNRAGKVQFHLKPTRLGANIVGGLVFGAGFALSAYCPGTGAAALGQMNWDALFTMSGMVIGSYLFAVASASLARSVEKWGDLGKITLPDALHVRRGVFAVTWGIVLIVLLAALERLSPTLPNATGVALHETLPQTGDALSR